MSLFNKILARKNDAPKSNQSETSGWVEVKTHAKDPWTSLKMPFTIGYHPDNDIFVNASSMRQISKIVTGHLGRIVVIDAQNQTPHSIDTLKMFGIQIQGPYSARPENMNFFYKTWQKFRGKETEWIDCRVPLNWKNWIPKTTELRMVGLLSILLSIVSLSMIQFDDSKSNQADRSNVAMIAEAGSVFQVNIKSTNPSSPYAKGALFEIRDAKSQYAERYVLTLSLAGLDLNRELEVFMNDSFIGHTTPSLTCIEKYCERDFVVNSDVLKEGSNFLKIKHSDERSSWGLRQVFFRGLEPASLEEIELGNQLLGSIERFHEERHLTVKNLRSGVDAAKQLEHMVDTRTGLESLKPRLQVVQSKLIKSFDEATNDLQFKLQKSLKLGSKIQAKGFVDQLMLLYPEATMAEYQQLSKIKSQLLEESK